MRVIRALIFTYRDDRRDPKCYNCNKYGHMAKDCPEPRAAAGACYVCKQTGHKAMDW